MESVVNIPFGYDPDRDRILPICLPARDDDGKPIAWGWFEAVARIENPLRNLTRKALGDEGYVSELTETALKIVWRNHGENYGRSPSARIYRQAEWSARDMKVGGSERDRRGLNVALEDLHEALRGTLLVDSCDYELQYNEELDLAKVGALFKSRGLDDVEEMLRHTRDGCTWKEIGERMNCDSNVAQRRFRRWLHRAAQSLKLAE
jgi:DNA-directed RNA polymerase specialized sigma24 family protein